MNVFHFASTEPPYAEFDNKMKSVRIHKTKEHLIAVKIFGYPAPMITWLKNGAPLQTAKKILISTTEKSSTLIVKNTDPDDSGIYTLKLTSAAGEVKYDFKLRVLDRPGPPEPPITLTDVSRHQITLCWNPPTDNGGSDITKYVIERCETSTQIFVEIAQSAATAFRYVDQNVTENCEYIYRVSAVNEIGTSEPAISNTVVARASYGKPSAPQRPITVRDVKDTSFTLGWCPPETDGGSPIIEYLVEKREASKKAWQPVGNTAAGCYSVLVSSLKKGVSYHFRITCRNELGSSPPLTTDEPIVAGHAISKYFVFLSMIVFVITTPETRTTLTVCIAILTRTTESTRRTPRHHECDQQNCHTLLETSKGYRRH